MKVLEFETIKGRFKLIDMPEKVSVNGWNGSIMIDEVNQISQEKYAKGFYLKNITEEQASSVMSKKDIAKYQGKMCSLNSVLGLNRFLESKGINLFNNPVPEPEYQFDNFGNGGMCESWINTHQEAEQKTFYNPYIFKL